MYTRYGAVEASRWAVGTVTGIAVRPMSGRGSGSQGSAAACACTPEMLLFGTAGIRELTGGYDIGLKLTPSIPIVGARCVTYEPTTNCVLFVLNQTAILQLDSGNAVSLVAGNTYTKRRGCGDGVGVSARFLHISALAPDGLGSVYVADGGRIRKLDLASRRVATLPDCWPQGDTCWTGLSYDAAHHVLIAATATAVCVVGKAPHSRGSGCKDYQAQSAAVSLNFSLSSVYSHLRRFFRKAAFVQLVAGDWAEAGFEDGAGAAARFTRISAILAGADGQLYILDGDRFRIMGPDHFVSTALNGVTDSTCLAVLPQGDVAVGGVEGAANLVIIRGKPSFGPSSPALGGRIAGRWPRPQQPSPAAAELHRVLSATAAASSGAAANAPHFNQTVTNTSTSAPSAASSAVVSGCAGVPSAPSAASGGVSAAEDPSTTPSAAGSVAGGDGGLPAVIVVHLDTDARFTAHRHVLAARSEFFRHVLDPDGGFADSGAREVSLPDADPRVIAWLLTYMYTGEFYMPADLLRPAAELAQRLLLPSDCAERLQEWLLAEVTPGSVVSDLVWAEDHGMEELSRQLKAYLLRHRQEVDLDEAGQLMERCPDLAATLLREMAAGP